MSGVQVQFLVGEIISHMTHGFKKKNKKKQKKKLNLKKTKYAKYRRKLLFILTSSERKKSLHSWNKNRMS